MIAANQFGLYAGPATKHPLILKHLYWPLKEAPKLYSSLEAKSSRIGADNSKETSKTPTKEPASPSEALQAKVAANRASLWKASSLSQGSTSDRDQEPSEGSRIAVRGKSIAYGSRFSSQNGNSSQSDRQVTTSSRATDSSSTTTGQFGERNSSKNDLTTTKGSRIPYTSTYSSTSSLRSPTTYGQARQSGQLSYSTSGPSRSTSSRIAVYGYGRAN